MLLHHGLGRELRDEGIGSFEELLEVARLDGADSGAEWHPPPTLAAMKRSLEEHGADSGAEWHLPPPPTPSSSLWVTSVGPNFANVFAVVRQVMGVSPSEVKALLNGPAFRVAVGWRSEFEPWRKAFQAAGATVEIR